MRVFIAIDLPEDLKEKIASLYKEIKGVRGKFVEKENLHITLKFLGELQPKDVEMVKKILRSIKYKKFIVKIKGLGIFNNRVLWFGVSKGFEDIINLHNLIDSSLKKLKFLPDLNFHPHITILRIKQVLSRNDFEKFLEKYKNLEVGEFEVREFKLKQSILRPEGPLYLDIEKYNLI